MTYFHNGYKQFLTGTSDEETQSIDDGRGDERLMVEGPSMKL